MGRRSLPSNMVVQQVGTDGRQNVLWPCVRQLHAFHARIMQNEISAEGDGLANGSPQSRG